MRRPAAALLGTVVGTVLLVGAKHGSASPAASSAAVAASDGATLTSNAYQASRRSALAQAGI